MASATWVKDMLAEKGAQFEECHHEQAFTAQAVAEQEHISGHRVAKVVVILAQGQPIALILPASRRVNFDRVKEMLGARDIHLASEAEMEQYFPDCETGAIPPLRHWPNMDVYMDQSLRVRGDILFQAGTHRDAVRMNFEDWFHLVEPQVESFSEPGYSYPCCSEEAM